MTFVSRDGDPAPGAASVSVTFTAFDQYVDPIINLFPPVNERGAILHARVRLLSGTIPAGAGLSFHVSSGASFAFASAPFLPGGNLPPGVWTPLDFFLAMPSFADPAFDPAEIVQIGVQIFSGADPGTGVPFVGNGETIMQIDTITD